VVHKSINDLGAKIDTIIPSSHPEIDFELLEIINRRTDLIDIEGEVSDVAGQRAEGRYVDST